MTLMNITACALAITRLKWPQLNLQKPFFIFKCFFFKTMTSADLIVTSGLDAGLVPEQEIQRATDEAAERSGSPAARLLQGPKEDEAPGRQAGGSGHFGTRGLRLLRR